MFSNIFFNVLVPSSLVYCIPYMFWEKHKSVLAHCSWLRAPIWLWWTYILFFCHQQQLLTFLTFSFIILFRLCSLIAKKTFVRLMLKYCHQHNSIAACKRPFLSNETMLDSFWVSSSHFAWTTLFYFSFTSSIAPKNEKKIHLKLHLNNQLVLQTKLPNRPSSPLIMI